MFVDLSVDLRVEGEVISIDRTKIGELMNYLQLVIVDGDRGRHA